MMNHGSSMFLKVLACVAAMAAAMAFAAGIVPSGPTAAEADASIVPARRVDVQVSHETRVSSSADSAPGRINSNEPRGFSLLVR